MSAPFMDRQKVRLLDLPPEPDLPRIVGQAVPTPPSLVVARSPEARPVRSYKSLAEAYPFVPAEAVVDLDGKGGAA